MGRPGTGGGHSHSSGGHSGRSSGGHRMSSSRPGVSHSSRSSYGSSHSYHHHHHYYGGYGNRTVYVEETNFTPLSMLVTIVLLAIFAYTLISVFTQPEYGQSSRAREKLSVNQAFDTHCILDETGWIENTWSLQQSLEKFYNKTGIQPYIVMKNVQGMNMSDSEKEDYANKWYDDNIDNEGTFLYMYFDDGESGMDVGYMAYVAGRGITDFVDSEAVEMFWNILDYQWVQEENTMTQVFNKTFISWGNRCMKVTRSPVFYFGIIGGVIFILVLVIVVINVLRKKQKEKAEQTKQILSTPIESVSSGLAEDVSNKYN